MADSSKFTKKYKSLFFVIGILIPVFFFVFLELILRIFIQVEHPALFVEDPNDHNYLVQNTEVSKRYFLNLTERPFSAHDPFLKNKSKDTYRVFVIGESTAAGFPYSHGVSFPRQLQYLLTQVYPEKNIEVINTSMAAISSYVFVDFISEVLEQSPDLILFHGGHNEYYGALTVGSSESVFSSIWASKLYMKLRRYSSFELIRRVLSPLKGHKRQQREDVTLLEEMVKDKEILVDSKAFDVGLRAFEDNYGSLLKKAKKNGVRVLSSTIVWNEMDVLPLEYSSQLPKPYLSGSEFSNTILDDVHSFAYNAYLEGLDYFEDGNMEAAKESFVNAKELDGVRFRAPNAVQKIITQVANENDTRVVDVYSEFEKLSPNGILGSSLLTEHVHPNEKGYGLIAWSFFESIVESRLVDDRIVDVVDIRNRFEKVKPYSELELRMGEIMLYQLIHRWPFVSGDFSEERYTIEGFPIRDKIDQLAKSVLMKDMDWPEAVYLYVDLVQEKSPNKAFSSLLGLEQEYPYVQEIKLKSNELKFKIDLDTVAYGDSSRKLLGKLPDVNTKISLVNQLLSHRMFDVLESLLNDLTFNVPNKGYYQKAIQDIKKVEASNTSDLVGNHYVDAAGAAIFMEQNEMALGYLQKAKELGADRNKINGLMKMINK